MKTLLAASFALILLAACGSDETHGPPAAASSAVTPTVSASAAASAPSPKSSSETAMTEKPAAPPSLTQDEAHARAFIEQLAAGKWADARRDFDPTMSGALDDAKLEATWRGLTSSVGALESIERVRSDKLGAYTTVLVTCAFEKTKLDAKVAYDAGHKVAGLFFLPAQEPWSPPPYAKPDAMVEREVTIGKDPWKLPGTLTLPKGAAKVPAVVLIHGSGPGDRDESIGPNKPFADLAAGLAARGVAVVRFDKRTRVYGPKLDLSTFTVDDESVNDALAAVKLLRETPEIDPARVFVAGHSLGGFLIPRIAERAGTSVHGYVILAGSTRDVATMMLEQMKYIGGLDGRVAPEETKMEADVAAAKKRIDALVGGAAPKPGEIVLGAGPAYWLDLAKYDVLASAKAMTAPVLVAQGGRDYQVTSVDFDRWKGAFAGKSNVTLRPYPALNHILASGEGKSSPEEYERRTPVDATLVGDVATFVLAP
jgi:hypothetical protein